MYFCFFPLFVTMLGSHSLKFLALFFSRPLGFGLVFFSVLSFSYCCF